MTEDQRQMGILLLAFVDIIMIALVLALWVQVRRKERYEQDERIGLLDHKSRADEAAQGANGRKGG